MRPQNHSGASSFASLLLAGAFVWGCSAPQGEPATPPQDGRKGSTKATAAKDGAPKAETKAATPLVEAPETELERHARHAADFERRGVLDRAAEAWKLSHEIEPTAEKALRSAALYEQSLAFESAREMYEALGKYPEHANTSQLGVQRAVRPKQTDEQKQRAKASLAEAREKVGAGDLPGAQAVLDTPELKRSAEGLSLLGDIHWRLGEAKAAQLAWSKARGASDGYYTLYLDLRGRVPTDFAPTNFAATDDSILFAAANGEVFTYDPVLRQVARGHAGLSWAETSMNGVGGGHFPHFWTFPDVEYPEKFGKPFSADESPTGDAVLWRGADEQLKFISEVDREVELRWTQAVGPERETSFEDPRRLGACFSGDGQQIFAGTADGQIVIFDRAGKRKGTWKAHDGKRVSMLAASPNGKLLASRGLDKMIVVWDLETHQPLAKLGPEREIRSLSFFPDDDTLEFARPWELIRLDWRSGKERGSYEDGVEILRVHHSLNRRWTAIGHYKTYSLNLLEGTKLKPERLTTEQVGWVAASISRDNKRLLATTPNGATLFDIETWSERRITDEYTTDKAALSHDGKLAAIEHVNGRDHELVIYDTSAGKTVTRIATGRRDVEQLSFVDDTSLLITTDAARIYDVPSGVLQFEPEGVERYADLSDGSLRYGADGWARFDEGGEQLKQLPCKRDGLTVDNPRGHYTCWDGENLHVHDLNDQSVGSLPLGSSVKRLSLSHEGQHVAIETGGKIFVGEINRNWTRSSEGAHAGLLGTTTLTHTDTGWLLIGGTDGLLALPQDGFGPAASLHFLENGGWFALLGEVPEFQTDGDPNGINAVVTNLPGQSPGVVFEGRRQEGAFGKLLWNAAPEVYASRP